jgi:REP element-mobilizing transposase RayT
MTRIHRFNVANGAYFVTATTSERRKVFTTKEASQVVIDALVFGRSQDWYLLLGYVIMPDHVHVLLAPRNGHTISEILRSLKRFTAQQLNRGNGSSGAFWQKSFYDHVIRDDEDCRVRLEYMHNNPLKAGLVKEMEDYRWSSCRNYHLGDDSLIEIDRVFLVEAKMR